MRGAQPVAARNRCASPTTSGVSFGLKSVGSVSISTGTVDRPTNAFQDRADRPGHAGGHVVDGSGYAARQQQRISSHGVSDVGEIALCVEVADSNHGRHVTSFDLRDLSSHARRCKRRALTRTGVVEGPRDDHTNPVLDQRTQPELLLRELADRIRARRRHSSVLVERVARCGVDRRGPGHEHTAGNPDPADRIQQIVRREHIAGEGHGRVLPRLGDVRRTRAVIHHRGSKAADFRHARARDRGDPRVPSEPGGRPAVAGGTATTQSHRSATPTARRGGFPQSRRRR